MQPFLSAAIAVLLGGIACFFVRSAPMIDAQYKPWATWIIAAGTAWIVLMRLGVVGNLHRTLGG
jgi:hypothetical protein